MSASASKTRARKSQTLRRQRDPTQGPGLFRPSKTQPPTEDMVAFIDDHRDLYGVEPICKMLPIAPSTCYAYKARERDASLCSTLAKRDTELRVEVQRVWETNFGVYGVREV